MYVLEIIASWKWERIFTTHHTPQKVVFDRHMQQHNPIILLRNLNLDIMTFKH